MDSILGKPQALKQVNLSFVRKALREKGSATRAELVEATQISGTTIRTLLGEMLENNEITEGGYDASIGGRKAVRYQLAKERFWGVALCLGDTEVRYLVVNICGEICESGSFAAGEDATTAICAFLDGLVAKKEIRSIGVGVPGIVTGMAYQRQSPAGRLESHPIGQTLAQRYGVPVLLENDLNAITLGFGQCYLRQFPQERNEDVHMAYISFERGCLSAGFLESGRILRGWGNFVGELGLFPMGGEATLDDLLASTLEPGQYAELVARLVAGICCILNPQFVALGGECFRLDCLPLIVDSFSGMLPGKMSAEIVYAKDSWHDYCHGMAHLTAEQIFADVRLIHGSAKAEG